MLGLIRRHGHDRPLTWLACEGLLTNEPQGNGHTEPKIVANQHYHWRIERRRNAITWFVDDLATPFLRYEDPRPLDGAGHEYFGFNNWETDTWFDNLVIAPL